MYFLKNYIVATNDTRGTENTSWNFNAYGYKLSNCILTQHNLMRSQQICGRIS